MDSVFTTIKSRSLSFGAKREKQRQLSPVILKFRKQTEALFELISFYFNLLSKKSFTTFFPIFGKEPRTGFLVIKLSISALEFDLNDSNTSSCRKPVRARSSGIYKLLESIREN